MTEHDVALTIIEATANMLAREDLVLMATQVSYVGTRTEKGWRGVRFDLATEDRRKLVADYRVDR